MAWGRENSWPYWDLNLDSLIVQPVASLYTDCAIPARWYPIRFRHSGEEKNLRSFTKSDMIVHRIYFDFNINAWEHTVLKLQHVVHYLLNTAWSCSVFYTSFLPYDGQTGTLLCKCSSLNVLVFSITCIGCPRRKVNVVGCHSIGYSKQKAIYMYMFRISNGFRDRAISLYSSQIVGKKEI
jgi:hypothetical protein